MYSTIRITVFIIFFLIALTITIILKKNNKKIIIVMVVVAMILCKLSMYIPVENFFINFPTAESLYSYMNTDKARKVFNGNNSCLFILKNNNQVVLISKKDGKWKIPVVNNNSPIAISNCEDCGVHILIDKHSGDTYLFVSSFGEYALNNLNDSNNSKFVLIDENDFYEYVAYIGNLDNNYKLKVNNHTYQFILSDVDSKIYEMQLVE